MFSSRALPHSKQQGVGCGSYLITETKRRMALGYEVSSIKKHPIGHGSTRKNTEIIYSGIFLPCNSVCFRGKTFK